MRHTPLVMGFALLPVMARYPLGAAVKRSGSMVKEGPPHFYERPVLSRLFLPHPLHVMTHAPPCDFSVVTRYPSTQFCACITSSPGAQSPARGEGLGRKIVIAQGRTWARTWRWTWAGTRRWTWAGRGGRGGYDQLVVCNERILPACGPLRRRIVACGLQRRMRGGPLKVLREKRH
jgi:hypothetical protein